MNVRQDQAAVSIFWKPFRTTVFEKAVQLRYRIDQPLCGMALDYLPPKSHLEVLEAAL